MKAFFAIALGVAAGIWAGPALNTALNLGTPTGGFDFPDLVSVLVTVVMIYLSMWMLSRV